ncbi:uncharacterized protein [Spinacia oleracea]|uniref:Uncharacterized protein isoform X1 n=1 Tax=Spinacia oleracea TaxID=3562 RepID=A0ABM3RW60_SPIOL|nr:uncharacterized protein LOC110802560 isoform X1 [Spinacia oleracea]
MDNRKGKNEVDEYDQEQHNEDESGKRIKGPDEPLRQISTDLVLAVPCSQIQRSQRLSDEGSGRKRTRETGSSSQSQFHHQLESGSGQQATQPVDNLTPPAWLWGDYNQSLESIIRNARNTALSGQRPKPSENSSFWLNPSIFSPIRKL